MSKLDGPWQLVRHPEPDAVTVATADGEIIAHVDDVEVAGLLVKAPLFASTIRAALEQINLYELDEEGGVDLLKEAIDLHAGVLGDSPPKEPATWDELPEDAQKGLAFLPFDFAVLTPTGGLCAAFECEDDARGWADTVSDAPNETRIWQRVRVNFNLTEWRRL